jgi:hypothetical protein
MLTEESLKIIVPAFTGLLGLFIGYFLKKSEYERQRRDELADRKAERLSKFRDQLWQCLRVQWLRIK